jgi:hypothetical protein
MMRTYLLQLRYLFPKLSTRLMHLHQATCTGSSAVAEAQWKRVVLRSGERSRGAVGKDRSRERSQPLLRESQGWAQ